MTVKNNNFSILKISGYPVLSADVLKFLHYLPDPDIIKSFKAILEESIEYTPSTDNLLSFTNTRSIEEAIASTLEDGFSEKDMQELIDDENTMKNYIYELPKVTICEDIYLLLVRVTRGKYYPIIQSTNKKLILHYIKQVDLQALEYKVKLIAQHHPELLTSKQNILDVFHYQKEANLEEISSFL
jgi:Lhr-like helicase